MASATTADSRMADILSLPAEILEYIWFDDSLDGVDISRLSCVCKKFSNVSDSNELWKRKMSERWPDLYYKYDEKKHYDWMDEYQARHRFGTAVRRKIAKLSPRFFEQEEVPRLGFKELEDMLTKHNRGADFVIDELMQILHDGNSFLNLTEKYYTQKALNCIRQVILRREWEEFIAQSPEKQSTERGNTPISSGPFIFDGARAQHSSGLILSKGYCMFTAAILLAQWCQPTQFVCKKRIRAHLDELAMEVREELYSQHSDHPACKTKPRDYNTEEELIESLWTPPECRQILEAINKVLYTKYGHRGNVEDYQNANNSYIDKEKLQIHHDRGRRLVHIQLVVPEGLQARIAGEQEYTYIDCFDGGRMLNQHDAGKIIVPADSISWNANNFAKATGCQVAQRMVRNLVNFARQHGQFGAGLIRLVNISELAVLLLPQDAQYRILLSRLYLHLAVNLQEAATCLQHPCIGRDPTAPVGLIHYLIESAKSQIEDEHKRMSELPTIEPKLLSKNPQIKFYVGTIMKHKKYHYTCVIYGWDIKCEASPEWINRMGVPRLKHQHNQPFFNVLVEDGSNRYAAEENLLFCPEPKEISHPEIGRYFKEFKTTHYIPNEEKRQQYPEDTEAREKYVMEKYGADWEPRTTDEPENLMD